MAIFSMTQADWLGHENIASTARAACFILISEYIQLRDLMEGFESEFYLFC